MNDYGSYSDVDLTELLRAGDRNAFVEIYNRYKFILHNHAWNKLRSKEEAQDVIHEVFSMVWDKREHLPVNRNLSGYLYSCVHNQFLNMVVHKKVKDRYISSIAEFAASGTVQTDHLVRERMLKDIIDREIDELPPRMREVFLLSRRQHLSHREIAEMMGITEQTVKKQMVYALKILKKKLGIVLFLVMYLFYPNL
ncbi:RNA polymerase sigma-70 factor [Pedobacter psychrodurus]|uniref:RNA polymerase sigma-70 factor n=1 Tax=Pedobacter psychrodurus TaxID=2530456 RepID=A0A4R0Q0L7_9SPHI|nr:RNA polymerase sigma-70 factor [Pedobacter psychrodurus]TCD28516.1 RNA polymerase sigma-70 factor [Pedobacter psychrodurus]